MKSQSNNFNGEALFTPSPSDLGVRSILDHFPIIVPTRQVSVLVAFAELSRSWMVAGHPRPDMRPIAWDTVLSTPPPSALDPVLVVSL